jgi:arsenite methyltransferase
MGTDLTRDQESESKGDKWAEWLLETRHGGDPSRLEKMLPALFECRDTVVGHAGIRRGDVVLDAGCGDELLGFRAVGEVGGAGQVIFADISGELLDRCRQIAHELGVADRCRFVQTGFPNLDYVDDASVDVAMTRSVLIYIEDKEAAFEALHRALRPGGRLSIFEPINSFSWPEPTDRMWGFDITGHEQAGAKVKQRIDDIRSAPESMVGFDERDLLGYAERAGFTDLHLDYHAGIESGEPDDWDTLLSRVPSPLSPPLGEILASALNSDEYTAVADHIQAQITAGQRQERNATAYLWATRR